MNISIYVITLKSKEDYKKSQNYHSLSKITNKIILIKGIILNNKQSDKYFFYAKSSIGITFAHLKTWKYILKNNKQYNNQDNNQNNKLNYNNYSLIFEDDAILNIKKTNYKDIINDIIKNNVFDIYKLHSDFNNGFTSLAAYIINNNSINKILNHYKIILGHLDFDLFILKLFNNIKILTHSYNIFKTDESESLNRKDKYNFLNLLNFKLCKRSDKSVKYLLCYKVFRIKEYEIIAFEIIMLFIFILNLFIKFKYLFLIILILLIL